ncbi:hypothetical protein Tco_0035099, partial [Tanacetum coccineum]
MNDDEEKMDEEEDDKITKELYKDVNINLGTEDAKMTDADQGGKNNKMFLKSLDLNNKLLNLDNTPSRLNETISQTASLFTVPVTIIPEITFAITVPPPPPFFNPQQATPTPTTLTPALPDFASIFRFNERVTNLEKDLSKMKQVNRYAQALSSIPVIVDCYMDNKLGEAINKAILVHKLDYRQEAQDEKNEYIVLIDTTMRTIINEEVTTQLPYILSQAVSDFATPVIEKNVAESSEAVVLTRSSSQPQSTYEAAATLTEFELIKILIKKMEKNKSFDKADHKRELYNALVTSYQTDKDNFDTYGEVFSLKSNRDDKDKDQDPSTGSDR